MCVWKEKGHLIPEAGQNMTLLHMLYLQLTTWIQTFTGFHLVRLGRVLPVLFGQNLDEKFDKHPAFF